MQRYSSPWIVLVLAAALLAVMLATTGCATQPSAQGTNTSTQPMQPAAQGQPSGDMASKMTCPMCSKGAPAAEKGTAVDENGVQVVKITLKDGYYSPNEIMLKAGIPAKLVFSGSAKDCAGKPKIAALNKQADFTETGQATMDLGTLSAGTYKITCGMGSAGGNLVVQ